MSKEEPYGSIGNLSNIYYYFTKDNCYPDSITLWYVNMTLNVYIHNQEYYFFTCGAKNPLSTNTCQNMNTCLCQRHISPITYRLIFVHKSKELL